MLYSLAPLGMTELDAIQALEKQLGKRVLALKSVDIEFDDLSEEQVDAIQKLEVELGLVIVAVR